MKKKRIVKKIEPKQNENRIGPNNANTAVELQIKCGKNKN